MLLNKFQTKKLQILPKTIKSIYFTKMDADADLAISRIPLFCLFVRVSWQIILKKLDNKQTFLI